MTKYVIVNADDFGMSGRVNAAVQKAHREGILTTASLMVAEPAWQEAVEIAKQNPKLGVGLHVTTTCDRALLSRNEIPDLIDAAGKFEANPLKVGLRYAFSKKIQAQLRREMEAQFERYSQTGLAWDHVDGHQHFHMHPTVFNLLLELCDKAGAHRLRVPQEDVRAHLRSGGDGFTPVTIGAWILQTLCKRNRKTLLARKTLGGKPVFLCDQVYGDYQSSNMTEDYTLKLLDRLEGATNEIYFHPGTDYARKLPPEQQTEEVRDVELQALLSQRIREKIQALKLTLGTYREIEAFLSSK